MKHTQMKKVATGVLKTRLERLKKEQNVIIELYKAGRVQNNFYEEYNKDADKRIRKIKSELARRNNGILQYNPFKEIKEMIEK